MKKVLYLLLCVAINIQSENNFAKVVFEKSENTYLAVFKDKNNNIKSTHIFNNYYGPYKIKKEWFMPKHPLDNRSQDKEWKQGAYFNFDQHFSDEMLLATAYDAFILKKNPIPDRAGPGFGIQLFRRSILGEHDEQQIQSTRLFSHNTEIGTITWIQDNRGKLYLLYGSLCSTIKAYYIDGPSSQEIECKGNRCHLLGADYNYILYAYVKGIRGYFGCTFNSNGIRECIIAAKKVARFKEAGEINFKNNRNNETVQNNVSSARTKEKFAILHIDPKNLPLIVFDKKPDITTAPTPGTYKTVTPVNYAVIYSPVDKSIFIIDPAKKTFFKHKLKTTESYCSLAVKQSFDKEVVIYLLPKSNQPNDTFTLKEVQWNLTKNKFKESNISIRKEVNKPATIIGITQFEYQKKDNYLVCATNKGDLYIIDENSMQIIDKIYPEHKNN